jgi:hypothetical protein
MFQQIKNKLIADFQQETLNKTAVSARWVAKRLSNAVRDRENLTTRRLAQTHSLLNRWIDGAQRRSFREVNTNKTNYPGRQKALELLNKHVGTEIVDTPKKQLPRMVANILGVPIFSRFTPHYNMLTKRIQPGRSWPFALHEYGHWMDMRNHNPLTDTDSIGRYGRELLANRNALKARDTLEQLNVPVSSRRELFDTYKKTLETYRLEELRKGLLPSWVSFSPDASLTANSFAKPRAYSDDAPKFVRALQDRVNDRFMTTSGMTSEGVDERAKFQHIMNLGKDYFQNKRPLSQKVKDFSRNLDGRFFRTLYREA